MKTILLKLLKYLGCSYEIGHIVTKKKNSQSWCSNSEILTAQLFRTENLRNQS